MSLFTFWAWVAVVGAFGLAHLIGAECQIRARLREGARREDRGRRGRE